MKFIFSIAVLGMALAVPATASPYVLYDGSIDADPVAPGVQSSLPEDQPWLAYNPLSETTLVAKSGYSLMDTTDDPSHGSNYSNGTSTLILDDSWIPQYNQTDFKNSSFPALNASTGYTLSLTGRMLAETHEGTTQGTALDINAGLSLYMVSDDGQAVAIGFRDGEVFNFGRWGDSTAYAEDNNHSVTYSTNQDDTFDLHVQDGRFTLSMNGTELFSDDMYTEPDWAALPQYNSRDFIALGDLSSLASVKYQLSSLILTVPEPSALVMILLGGSILLMRRPRRCT